MSLRSFYETETSLSQQDPNRLAKPSEPEDAELGVAIHMLLQDKGLNPDFMFGFDWHWWAEQWLAQHENGIIP